MPADEYDLLDMLVDDWQRERPDLDVSAMAIVGRVTHLAEILRGSADRALKEFDLHYTDLDVLATLRRSGEPFCRTPTELTRSVLLTSGAMTAALRRLEKKGLVKRAPEERDGRVRTVALTKSGVKLIDKAIAVRFADASRSIQVLSDEDRAQLARLLRTLLVSLSDHHNQRTRRSRRPSREHSP